jgi:signal transduction histidine kinase
MAKRKGITISLAAKCQLLFGLAVLVIIAGALAVPWQRMEQLAKQPNKKAARFAADLVFREAHAGFSAWAPQTPRASTQPATATEPSALHDNAMASSPATASTQPGWEDASLLDTPYPRPRILIVSSPNGGFLPQPGPDGRPSQAGDAIASRALRVFRQQPQEVEFGEIGSLREEGGDSARIYRYAAAVRADASCLKCHGEYAAWMPGAGGTIASAASPATVPATGAATQSVIAPARGEVVAPRVSIKPGPAAGGSGGGGGGATPSGMPANPGGAGAALGPVVAVVRVDVPFQTDENQLLLNRIVIVVAGMLGGALAIVVFYLITSRLILQPVRVLKNTAEKVAKGDLNIRSAISTGDEFQHLSETFNTMLATLQGSQDQLEATNRSLDTRVGELAQSNVDLYEANRLKSEFLTNVTHELRTPLNAIIGFAELLVETVKDPKQQRYCENIRASAKQLLDLINDLLDLAKIEAGKLVLREEKVSVADVCEAMANFMRPLAQKKNIAMELSIDPAMPLIMTDPGRFQQILYNFLSNAIKFTPPEGRVSILARGELPPARVTLPAEEPAAADRENVAAAEETPDYIRVSITDSGPGITAEDQKVIFEKFRQLDGSVTRQHSGSGLGLAISRELANMLGARIELTSTLGKGSTFSLIIPVANPQRIIEVHATMENV